MEQSDPSTIGRGYTRHLQQIDQEEARKLQGTLSRADAQYFLGCQWMTGG